MIRLHYIQHVPFEGIGYIETYAAQQGFEVSGTHVYQNERFPEIGEFDWLVIMGGPMSVYEDHIHPWISGEKKFISQAVFNNKTVIGICLGAQLIASALGARVYPNSRKEIGWFPVSLTPEAKTGEAFGGAPQTFMALHWHGDTFDIPSGAVHCCRSETCANQAFVYKRRVVGLQFHCEVTEKSLGALIENCRGELRESPTVQGESALRSGMRLAGDANAVMTNILDGLNRAGGGKQ